LKKEDVINLERMAEKSAQNLIEGIEKSKGQPFEKVLFALGIRFVGETVAKTIASSLKNIDNIINSTKEELESIDEIGERIAQSVVNFFQDKDSLELVNRLREYGLNFEIEKKEKRSSKLDGLKFVISGVFENFDRKELKVSIEKNGGKVMSSLSKNTDYLIAGKNMGPSKKEKAENLNIPIIDEMTFEEMIS